MLNKLIIVSIIISCLLSLSLANKTLCDDILPQNSSGLPLPNLPNQFQTVIEHNYRSRDLNSNYTTEYEEFYDFINNRATVIKRVNFKEIKQYFLYNTGEQITIIDNECAVTPIQISFDNPFGILTVNSSYQINSPSYVLKFGFNLSTVYLGAELARGINVQKWQSCAYFQEINTTVDFSWTFSDPAVWNSSIIFGNSSVQFPVEMAIEAITDQGQSWSERIEYTFYRPYIAANPEIFETPKGVYCEGRKATKPLPKVPNRFSYRIEATLVDLNQTTSQSEWYDFDANLARIDYQPLSSDDKQAFGDYLISEVHDFNEGIRYIVNKNKEICLNVTILDSDSFDTIAINNSNFVRIRTALEMFHFDKVNYQFHGSRKIRDIDCDVWIAKRTDWPPNKGYTSTWEWYFMSNRWTSVNSGQTEFNVPVQLVLTQYIPFSQTIVLTTTTVYNYFDFVERNPKDVIDFGVQSCYEGAKSKHLQVKFENLNSEFVTDKTELKNEFINQVSGLTYLLPTRIDRIDVDFNGKDTTILFKLLDRSSVHGNIINPVEQISLEDAESLLRNKINNGELKIRVNNQSFKASKDSLININEFSNNPFTNYIVIIVITCGSLLGLVIGIVSVVLITKCRGKSTGQPSLTMSGLMNSNFDRNI